MMITAREDISTYWLMKWAERHGIAKKDAREAMDLNIKLTFETDNDEDAVEALVVGIYQTIPVETIFDKFEKAKNNEDGEN